MATSSEQTQTRTEHRRGLLDEERSGDRERDQRRAERAPRSGRTSRAADRDRNAERDSRRSAEMRRRADRGLYFELPRELGEDRGRRPAAAVADLAPRAIVATARPHGAAAADLRAAGAPVAADWSHVTEPPPPRGRSGRQTVTITGQGAEGYATRRGTRSSTAQRHQAIRRHERDGFRPDRVAMYAVMLGVMLMLAAAVSAHAAVLAHHALTH